MSEPSTETVSATVEPIIERVTRMFKERGFALNPDHIRAIVLEVTKEFDARLRILETRSPTLRITSTSGAPTRELGHN